MHKTGRLTLQKLRNLRTCIPYVLFIRQGNKTVKFEYTKEVSQTQTYSSEARPAVGGSFGPNKFLLPDLERGGDVNVRK